MRIDESWADYLALTVQDSRISCLSIGERDVFLDLRNGRTFDKKI